MDNEIAESEVIDMPMELSVFDPLDAGLKEAKEKNALLVFDYNDKQGNKDARSWVAHLRTLKAPISELHKTGKAEALKYCKEWDNAKSKRITAIEEMIEHHDKPLREIKDAEAKKKADEEAKIKAEEERLEAERQAEIEAREAKLAADKAELAAKEAEFEQRERERTVAEEATRKAKEEAARILKAASDRAAVAIAEAAKEKFAAEVARKQAIVEAEYAKAEAIRKTQAEAAAELQKSKEAAIAIAKEKEWAIERTERIALEKKEAEEMAETKRINDEQHRLQIHKEIYEYLGCIVENEIAKQVFHALHDGKIPHTRIQY